jgi:site-specific DNA-cytosine methylase
MDRDLTAVGVNIFAGGFTLGVERHFKVLAHLEHDDYGVRTFRLNRPHVPVFYPPSRWPIDRLAGEVDFLYANPPCAIVSVCGRCLREGKDGWRTDPRTGRIRDITRLATQLRPKVVAMESVVQLYTRARELVAEQSAVYAEAGYSVTHLLVNTGWHGTPQVRKRYFLVAHQVPLAFERLNYAPPETAGEVLASVKDPGWLPPVKQEHANIWADVKPGRGLREVWERVNPPETRVITSAGVRGRPRMTEYRIDPTKPMGVFYGDFFWHPNEPRRLGLEESKALCGFPPEWRFHRPDGAFSEMARGVMPGMADWLARQVATSLRQSDLPHALAAPGWQHRVDLREAPQ